jgi:multidrug efflux pump subunit AcrA (membrane-fusion protein)
LQSAKDNADVARAKLQAVSGPDRNALDAAQLSVESAQLGVQSAQARLDQVRRGPAAADVQNAQNAVSQAEAALARAQGQGATDTGAGMGDATAADIAARQATIDKDRSDIAKLDSRRIATQLVAPFSGTVASVRVKAGETVDSTRPAITLAKPGDPMIRATLSGDDVDKAQVGQTVKVEVPGATSTTPTSELSGRVVSVSAGETGAAKTAQIDVDWADGAPKLGTIVTLGLVLQEKDDVLLVPKKAVRTVNSRSFVQVVEGSTKRVVNVQLGIVGTNDAEVVSGLTEGQLVVVAP